MFARNSSGPAATDLCWEAVGRWPNSQRLQHSKGVDAAPGASSAWRRQETQEEELHNSEEKQTQEEEGQACSSQVLQGWSRLY